MIEIHNNFEKLHASFTKDTGLNPKENPDKYIAYVQARSNDAQMQIISGIYGSLTRIETLLSKLIK